MTTRLRILCVLVAALCLGPLWPSYGGPASGAGPGPAGGGSGFQGPPAPPSGGGGGGSFLEGVGAWDREMVREFVSKEMHVAFPAGPVSYAGSEMAAALNPEFADRLEALLAVYQAHGGSQTVGIVPRTGGLRRAEEQRDLYGQCRRIRGSNGGRPVGDGSLKEHWEVVPFMDRCCGTSTVTYLFHEADGTIRGYTTPRAAESNCPVVFHQKLPDGSIIPVLGPITMAWVSWHNLGLAVDLREIGRDSRGNLTLVMPSSPAWYQMEEAAGHLGMVWGGWWKSFPDPGHMEWHPLVRNPEQFAAQSGSALALSDVQMGYRFRFPSRLYVWDGAAGSLNALQVYDFVLEDGWFAVKAHRFIRGVEDGAWDGTWTSFTPAIPLFPAYIPTIRFGRDESQWPQDMRWRGQARLLERHYFHRVASDGTVTIQASETMGTATYRLTVDVADWQKRANIATQRSDSDKGQLIRMRGASVYEVRLSLSSAEEGRLGWRYRWQEIDKDGFTTEGDDLLAVPRELSPLSLTFAWNRETGVVGTSVDLVPAGKDRVFDIVRSSRIGPALPKDAWDRERFPDWAASNPKPREERPDWCPPGVSCAPRR